MTPSRRRAAGDTELLARIEAWLRERLAPKGRISIVPRDPEGGGFSSELFFIEVASGGTTLRREWVLRRERTRDALFPEADFVAEARIQQVLRQRSELPVPEILWVEEDPGVLGGRFYVMERLRGDAPPHLNDRGWVAEARAEQRGGFWRSGLRRLAEIHAFDWRGTELTALRRAKDHESELSPDIEWWWRLYERHSEHAFPDLVVAAFDRMRSAMPTDEACCLSWGDARHQNMLFRDWECVAVLDWEMATLGAPEKDVAFLLAADRNLEAAGIPRLEGLPAREQTIAYYESVSGRTLRNLEYYEGFALLRMLVIQARFMKLGLMPRTAQAREDNVVARLLQRFVDA